MIVVDASLATKLMIREADSDAAIDFFDEYGRLLCGPDLLLTEVCGAIVRRASADKALWGIVTEALERWIGGWERNFIAYRLTANLADRASTMALELGHPFPGCVYLALAEQIDADLATCDVRFRDRAIERYPRIKLLADYAAPG